MCTPPPKFYGERTRMLDFFGMYLLLRYKAIGLLKSFREGCQNSRFTADCADHAHCADWEFFFLINLLFFSFFHHDLLNEYFLLFDSSIDAWKPGMVLKKIYNQCPSGQKFLKNF